MKKVKVLFVGWERHYWDLMKENELKKISEIGELRFAQYNTSAIDIISQSKLVEKDPVEIMIFSRDFINAQPQNVKLISDFCEKYAETFCPSVIGIIHNDQDEVRNMMHGIHEFVQAGSWDSVFIFIRSRANRKNKQ